MSTKKDQKKKKPARKDSHKRIEIHSKAKLAHPAFSCFKFFKKKNPTRQSLFMSQHKCISNTRER